MAESKKMSALQRRIAAGKAEPISERERAQLAELRETYAKRFGQDAANRLDKSLRAS